MSINCSTVHTIAEHQQEVPARGIPDKSSSVKAINRYLRHLTDQQIKYYADHGISKSRTQIILKPLLSDLRSSKITASLAFTLITDQLEIKDIKLLNDRLANEIDFLCGEEDAIFELWEALDIMCTD